MYEGNAGKKNPLLHANSTMDVSVCVCVCVCVCVRACVRLTRGLRPSVPRQRSSHLAAGLSVNHIRLIDVQPEKTQRS